MCGTVEAPQPVQRRQRRHPHLASRAARASATWWHRRWHRQPGQLRTGRRRRLLVRLGEGGARRRPLRQCPAEADPHTPHPASPPPSPQACRVATTRHHRGGPTRAPLTQPVTPQPGDTVCTGTSEGNRRDDQAAEAAGSRLLGSFDRRLRSTTSSSKSMHRASSRRWEWLDGSVSLRSHDRAQPIIGHEFAGVVPPSASGCRTLIRTAGVQDHWAAAMEPWPNTRRGRATCAAAGNLDFTMGASLPISGLTAWQGLFQHGRLQAGQTSSRRRRRWSRSAVTNSPQSSARHRCRPGGGPPGGARLASKGSANLDDEDLRAHRRGRPGLQVSSGGDIQRRSVSIIRGPAGRSCR